MSDLDLYPTTPAREALAERFDLPYFDHMQDWEWEVAECGQFNDYLEAYENALLPDDQLFSLMEMLIQCAEMADSPASLESYFSKIRPHLQKRRDLHKPTIEYWSCNDASSAEHLFNVSQDMRNLRYDPINTV